MSENRLDSLLARLLSEAQRRPRRERRRLYAFIDESGKPHQLYEGPFVLAAVTVTEDRVEECRYAVMRFIEEWNRMLQSEYIEMKPVVSEIHAREVVQGEGFWRGVKPEHRNQFILSAAELVSRLPLYLNIVVVRLAPGVEIRNPRGVRRHAFKLLVERILYSERHVDELLVFIDSAGVGEDEQIKAEIIRGVEEGFAELSGRPLVTFVDSRGEPLVQVADLVAYIVRNVEMHRYRVRGVDLGRAYRLIERRIRPCPGRETYEGCGLKRWLIDR